MNGLSPVATLAITDVGLTATVDGPAPELEAEIREQRRRRFA